MVMMDEILRIVDRSGVMVVKYADDLVILDSGKFPSVTEGV